MKKFQRTKNKTSETAVLVGEPAIVSNITSDTGKSEGHAKKDRGGKEAGKTGKLGGLFKRKKPSAVLANPNSSEVNMQQALHQRGDPSESSSSYSMAALQGMDATPDQTMLTPAMESHGILDFRIAFAGPKAFFAPRWTFTPPVEIKGKIILLLSRPLLTRHLMITYEGHVEWRTEGTHFEGDGTSSSVEHTCWPRPDISGTSNELPAGVHTFQFQLRSKTELVPSLKVPFGFSVHRLDAVLALADGENVSAELVFPLLRCLPPPDPGFEDPFDEVKSYQKDWPGLLSCVVEARQFAYKDGDAVADIYLLPLAPGVVVTELVATLKECVTYIASGDHKRPDNGYPLQRQFNFHDPPVGADRPPLRLAIPLRDKLQIDLDHSFISCAHFVEITLTVQGRGSTKVCACTTEWPVIIISRRPGTTRRPGTLLPPPSNSMSGGPTYVPSPHRLPPEGEPYPPSAAPDPFYSLAQTFSPTPIYTHGAYMSHAAGGAGGGNGYAYSFHRPAGATTPGPPLPSDPAAYGMHPGYILPSHAQHRPPMYPAGYRASPHPFTPADAMGLPASYSHDPAARPLSVMEMRPNTGSPGPVDRLAYFTPHSPAARPPYHPASPMMLPSVGSPAMYSPVTRPSPRPVSHRRVPSTNAFTDVTSTAPADRGLTRIGRERLSVEPIFSPETGSWPNSLWAPAQSPSLNTAHSSSVAVLPPNLEPQLSSEILPKRQSEARSEGTLNAVPTPQTVDFISTEVQPAELVTRLDGRESNDLMDMAPKRNTTPTLTFDSADRPTTPLSVDTPAQTDATALSVPVDLISSNVLNETDRSTNILVIAASDIEGQGIAAATEAENAGNEVEMNMKEGTTPSISSDPIPAARPEIKSVHASNSEKEAAPAQSSLPTNDDADVNVFEEGVSGTESDDGALVYRSSDSGDSEAKSYIDSDSTDSNFDTSSSADNGDDDEYEGEYDDEADDDNGELSSPAPPFFSPGKTDAYRTLPTHISMTNQTTPLKPMDSSKPSASVSLQTTVSLLRTEDLESSTPLPVAPPRRRTKSITTNPTHLPPEQPPNLPESNTLN